MRKNFLKNLLISLLQLALIAGLFWYLQSTRRIDGIIWNLQKKAGLNENQKNLEIEKPFPELNGQVERNFNWEYKGKKYSLNMTLHDSVYEYYKSLPKSYSYRGELPANWEEEYYGMFLKINEKDNSISMLANDLQRIGKQNKLTDDQIVELILSFVQTIDYDDAKAKNILANTNNESMLYPYELLYQQKGVCSDKSLLTYAILKQLGYGVTLLAYEDDNHMAVGIQCPKEYSSYGDGFCFAETTSTGNKIGILPRFNADSNKAVELGNLTANDLEANLQELGQAKAYQKIFGKEYKGIIFTQKTLNEIEALKKSINEIAQRLKIGKKEIDLLENEIQELKLDLEKYQKDENIKKFNDAVEEYNDTFEKYQNKVEKYNREAALYNQTIARYNTLIRQ